MPRQVRDRCASQVASMLCRSPLALGEDRIDEERGDLLGAPLRRCLDQSIGRLGKENEGDEHQSREESRTEIPG